MLKSLRYGKEFEELYTRNYSRLYYYAYQFLNDTEVSRDVVNDAFEYVWKNYENFRKRNVVAILFQSVRNKSIDTFRHNKVEENYVALYSRMFSEEEYTKYWIVCRPRRDISWKNVILTEKSMQMLLRC